MFEGGGGGEVFEDEGGGEVFEEGEGETGTDFPLSLIHENHKQIVLLTLSLHVISIAKITKT